MKHTKNDEKEEAQHEMGLSLWEAENSWIIYGSKLQVSWIF